MSRHYNLRFPGLLGYDKDSFTWPVKYLRTSPQHHQPFNQYDLAGPVWEKISLNQLGSI